MKKKQLLIVEAPCTLADTYREIGKPPNLYEAWAILSSQFEKIRDDYTVIILIKDKNANKPYDWEYNIIRDNQELTW